MRVYKLLTHRMVNNLGVVIDKLNKFAVVVRTNDGLCIMTYSNDISIKSKIEKICSAYIGIDYSLEIIGD